MQPVQFQCGHCGQLMGVSSEHIGQQVRCPHCQQIVVAPPPASEAAQGPPTRVIETVPPPPAIDGDDIFSPVALSDDLFGRSEAPRIEMPIEVPAPPLSRQDAAPPQQPQATEFSSLPWVPPESAAAPPSSLGLIVQSDSAAAPSLDGAPAWPSGAVTETLAPPPTDLPPSGEAPLELDGETSFAGARSRRRTEQNAPWFLLLVFCPLLLYAIAISIFAFFLYRHAQHLQEQLRNPFENMPDVGDDPGVHKGKKVIRTDRYKPELATLPLPEHLCTTLGNPIRIGDLQVTPNRVERKRVSVIVETWRTEPCPNDSLVLYLDLKNLSTEYSFAPLDNYFDRYWSPKVDQFPPLTQLEIGNAYRCYGGPAQWYPRGNPSHNQRQWVKGRHEQAEFLQPGEEKQLFVCTDGEDAKAAALLFGGKSRGKYHGSFLWRVRVRRGLVHFQDKDYSATAVVGIRFTDKDIREAVPEAE